jgi:predicted nucleic acid-binding protein
MRKIIADSSSLILLYKCGAAGLFINGCCCIVPEAVRDELTAEGYKGSDFFKQYIENKALTVKTYSCDDDHGKKLHKGESGVISLYKDGAGEYVLIDDGYGAAYCRDNRIPYINALLAVKILLFGGIIDHEKYKAITEWLQSNGRYSTTVIEWAENAGYEELKAFLL